MNDELVDRVGAVTREVRDGERDGTPTRTVYAARDYDTDIDDLWDAITSAERLPRWFAPIRGELKLRGRYQFEGNAGGTITECEKPRKLGVTWEFGGGVSWVNVRLSEHRSGTRLELEHTPFVDPHWEQFGPGAVGVGWDLGLFGLQRHLEDPEALRPPEGDPAWLASDEAKRFMTALSVAWGTADIVAGADESRASAAAESTRSEA